MTNEKTKYLYGASVQGIQDFIFQTNKLKEIVGASELVEQICTTAFDEFAKNGDSIVRAAGNIKYIFKEEGDCKKAVTEFPRKVMNMAPGITISQAVVKYDSDFGKAVEELEKNLKTQRNKPVRSITLGLMAIARASNTGLPGITYDENKLIDEGTSKKRKVANEELFKLPKKSFGTEVKISKENLPFEIDKMTEGNSWIAVIHADGNGFGKIIQEIGGNERVLSEVSIKLDEATTCAARAAYKSVSTLFDENKMIPMRPIVLSGDDLTLICRADIAIPYTQAFLAAFELETTNKFASFNDHDILKAGLTACAGIAFVKSSYPFHYAVHLAEELCGRAKKEAQKGNENSMAPSCLMFHKVQDSFIENFDKITLKELSPHNMSFEYGPYYINKSLDRTTIEELQKMKDDVKDNNAIKSHLRQWLEMLFDDPCVANQKMKKIIRDQKEDIVKKLELNKFDKLSKESIYKIPLYDILSLASIDTRTKNKEGKL